MCNWDWIGNGVIPLLAVLLGLFAAPLFEGLWVLWRGPKLKVSFVKADCIITSPDTEGIVQLFYRLRITNLKPRIAEGVRAWLVNIERKNNETGPFQPTDYHDSFPLIFSDQPGIESVTIPKGVVWHVDVIAFHPKIAGFTPCLRGDRGQRLEPLRYTNKLYLEEGTYRLTIDVSANKRSPERIKLYFWWKGKERGFIRTED